MHEDIVASFWSPVVLLSYVYCRHAGYALTFFPGKCHDVTCWSLHLLSSHPIVLSFQQFIVMSGAFSVIALSAATRANWTDMLSDNVLYSLQSLAHDAVIGLEMKWNRLQWTTTRGFAEWWLWSEIALLFADHTKWVDPPFLLLPSVGTNEFSEIRMLHNQIAKILPRQIANALSHLNDNVFRTLCKDLNFCCDRSQDVLCRLAPKIITLTFMIPAAWASTDCAALRIHQTNFAMCQRALPPNLHSHGVHSQLSNFECRLQCLHPTQIQWATDFSGMDALAYVMRSKSAYISSHHVFSTEIGSIQQAFLRRNWNPRFLFHNVLRRKHPQMRLHLYVAGPPCQSFAPCGKKKGWRDERSKLYISSVEYIEEFKPCTFLLENSDRIATGSGWITFRKILARLRAAGYSVATRRLNTRDYGLPQNRSRQWVAGIHEDSLRIPFEWPEPIPCVPLSALLRPAAMDGAKNRKLPTGSLAIRNIQAAEALAREQGLNSDWAVREHMSAAFQPEPRPLSFCPALLHSKRQGYWLGSRRRHLTSRECARIRGFCFNKLRWPESAANRFALLGNTVSICVFEPLVCALLRSIGHDVPNSWACGRAQSDLRIEAQQDPMSLVELPQGQPSLHSFWNSLEVQRSAF